MENENQTRILGRPTQHSLDDEATRIVNREALPSLEITKISSSSSDTASDKTVILGPTTRKSSPSQLEVSDKNQLADPVVGWLAIISGPGAGDFVRLGYGMNNIGRSDDQRCKINFGDEKISRQNHANVTYDPRGRKFYLQHGGGQNLTYLSNQPVLQPIQLTGGENITLGNTTLRFVPLCGDNFEYSDNAEQP
jgi:hypothetical protein